MLFSISILNYISVFSSGRSCVAGARNIASDLFTLDFREETSRRLQREGLD